MKILHTSDWHLGKRTAGRSRLDEQRAALAEIAEIAKEEKADVILVAGDVFDTFVPPAEAEELFYSAVVELAKTALVVAVAGNHDDARRLNAPSYLAGASGIALCDDDMTGFKMNRSDGTIVTGGENYLRVEKNGEVLNLAILGYPTAGKILDLAGEANFSDFVRGELEKGAKNFVSGEINGVLTHLFTAGGESMTTDERELGGSKIISPEVLRFENCGFVALGHIHKPYVVSDKDNIAYSGSLLRYDFADRSDKRVVIYESKPDGSVARRERLLTSPKPLIKIAAGSEDEVLMRLAEITDGYAWVEYTSDTPLPASAVSAFRKFPCYLGITAVCTARKTESVARRGKTDGELFSMFYESKRGEKPSDEIVGLFLQAVNGEIKEEL